MRGVWLGIAAAGLSLGLALAVWLWRREAPAAALALGPGGGWEEFAEEVVRGHSEQEPRVAPDGVQSRDLADPQVATTPASAPLEPTLCRVTGRLVDEGGRGIAGVTLRLFAWRTWAVGLEIPRLPGRYDQRGFETRSAANGCFALVAPPPTAELVVLTATPDTFHDALQIRFGGEDVANRPPLRAGATELGELLLAATGAISGRVTDRDGAPIEGARARACTEAWNTLGREGRSDAGGFYRIEHLRPGVLGVEVAAEGWLSRFREPLEVAAGRVTAGADFVLERAPTLSGRVVDESGAPLAGARLTGWGRGGGAAASGRSGEDGRFALSLPEDQAYGLECTLDGYVPHGEPRPRHYHEPGTTDVVIVLARCPTTRFRVVDEETGEPIVRFGIRIEWSKGARAEPQDTSVTDARPRIGEHPGGELELPARPGIDTYQVVAPGYALAEGEIEHPGESSNLQVLHLSRGARVRGRVLLAGEPVRGARVEVALGYLSWTTAPEDFAPTSTDLAATETDERGLFEVAGLVRGVHRVQVFGPSGATVTLAPFRLKRREVRVLGDLALLAPATLMGRVLPPEGVAAGGLKVGLDDWHDEIEATTDAAGRFRLEGLAPGAHEVWLAPAPGRVAGGASLQVDLEEGRTLDVELDARDRGVCAVSALVLRCGEPLPRARVFLKPERGGDRLELGETDADGRAFGHVRAAGRARAIVAFPWWTELEHPGTDVELVRGGEVELALDFELGELEIELPTTLELPRRSVASLTLRPVAGGERLDYRLELAEGRVVSHWGAPAGRLEGRVLTVGGLPPGELEAELRLRDLADEDGAVLDFRSDDDDVRLAATARLRLRARQATRWILTPADVR